MADPLQVILERLDELQTGLETTRKELRSDFQSGLEANRKELRSDFQSGLETTREELRSDFQSGLETTRKELRAEFREGFETLQHDFNELHRHFDVVAEDLEGRIRQVAEGVVQNSEKIEAFKKENARAHDEIKSMIRLPYRDLDRRVTSLEGRTDAVEERVDRLESQAS